MASIDISTFYIAVMFMVQCSSSIKLQETREQTCAEQKFQARCPFSQKILITDAKYGHIEVSKCVAVDFGYFGCYSNVKDILSQRCDRKSRCEVTMPDNEIAATKTCLTGLAMYLDVTYVCIPDTISNIDCGGVDVTQRTQYLTSMQLEEAGCNLSQDQSSGILPFSAPENLKIKFTFTHIQGQRNTSSFGYIDEGNDNQITIVNHEEKGDSEVTSQSDKVRVVLESNAMLLISFQAFGCQDPSIPAYTWFTREGDTATVGCDNNDHTWHLNCVGSKWLGTMGNCSDIPKEVIQETEESSNGIIVTTDSEETSLSKEVLFALIIGITLFLCVVVVTIGYVCLRSAKYEAKAAKKNNMELTGIVMGEEDMNSWSRSTFLRKDQQQSINNQWQQSLPKAQIVQSNGNTPKYYILDRTD